MAAIFYMLYIS